MADKRQFNLQVQALSAEEAANSWKIPPYDPVIARAMCEAVAKGTHVTMLATLPGMPRNWSVVYRWREQVPEFREMLEVAQESAADKVDADIEVIAATVANGFIDPKSAQVAFNIASWRASKLHRKYREQRDQHIEHEIIQTPEQVNAALESLVAQLPRKSAHADASDGVYRMAKQAQHIDRTEGKSGKR